MAAERIIGVDFGTSTSVIRVKRYQDGRPVGDQLETKPVTFNMGNTMVPTLIEKISTGGAYFGHEAENGHRNAKTFQNFKVDIENPDEGIRRQARELTAEFFQYLAKSYRAQSEGGYLGESDDKERTIISYPVKWSDETKAFMVQTARDAGFPNVEGVDEAQAAIQTVTVQNADLLTRNGYFRDGVPVNILLIDMGAGTTDLVLCRHTPGAQSQTDVLSTWPKGGNALFGGREVDELLRSYISQTMPEDSADLALKKIAIEKYKAWKEGTVSPALDRGEVVDYFAELDYLLNLMDIDAEYSVSRTSLEDFAADYLHKFPELVDGCVSAAGLSRDDVDLVILTGGHSQWYFVREMLSGRLDRFGDIGLKKVQADPERVIPITLPQETVALGLVYGPLAKSQPKYDPYRAIAVRWNKYGQCNVNSWRDIMVIDAGHYHTVGLKNDGTVIAVGNNDDGQCNVSNWRDIVAIAAGYYHTVGLRHDGTVIAVGENPCNVSSWRDIVAIAAGSCYTVGLKNDGTVITDGNTTTRHAWTECGGKILEYGINDHGQFNVSGWRDIEAIAAGWFHTVGLKKDGSVVAVGYRDDRNPCDVSSWRDIEAIAAGWLYTVGLKKDGTVIAVGSNESGQCNVGDWRDIVAIAAGGWHTVGLKKDGTVIAVGFNQYGQCNVNGWHDIVAIVAGYNHTIGLKTDGTLVAVGWNNYGQTNVGKLGKLF